MEYLFITYEKIFIRIKNMMDTVSFYISQNGK